MKRALLWCNEFGRSWLCDQPCSRWVQTEILDCEKKFEHHHDSSFDLVLVECVRLTHWLYGVGILIISLPLFSNVLTKFRWRDLSSYDEVFYGFFQSNYLFMICKKDGWTIRSCSFFCFVSHLRYYIRILLCSECCDSVSENANDVSFIACHWLLTRLPPAL